MSRRGESEGEKVSDNSDKIILDLCGGSGAWSKPYKENGYDVKLITLPEYDITQTEFYGKMLVVRNGANFCVIPYKNIYGILAAPPCTEFSIAKGNRPRDFEAGMRTVEACVKIIWEVRKYAALKFWALENPRGLLRQFMGKPRYAFEQWQFGGNKRKATDIWGYFNEPAPKVKEFPFADYTVKYPCGSSNGRAWGKCEYPTEYEEYINSLNGYTAKRAAARAITPEGFAKAFYKANK